MIKAGFTYYLNGTIVYKLPMFLGQPEGPPNFHIVEKFDEAAMPEDFLITEFISLKEAAKAGFEFSSRLKSLVAASLRVSSA